MMIDGVWWGRSHCWIFVGWIILVDVFFFFWEWVLFLGYALGDCLGPMQWWLLGIVIGFCHPPIDRILIRKLADCLILQRHLYRWTWSYVWMGLAWLEECLIQVYCECIVCFVTPEMWTYEICALHITSVKKHVFSTAGRPNLIFSAGISSASRMVKYILMFT